MGPALPSPHFKLNLDPSWTPEPSLLCWVQHQLSHSIKKPTQAPRHPSTGSSPPEFRETPPRWRLERGRGEALSEQTWDLGPNLQIIFDIYKVSLDDFFTLQRWAQLQRTLGRGISPGSYFCPSAEERCPNSCFNPRAGSGGRILDARAANRRHLAHKTKLFDGLGGWQRPHRRVSGTLSVHTNTSALCIFSGGGSLVSQIWGHLVVEEFEVGFFFVEPSLSKEAGCLLFNTLHKSLLQL